MDDLNPAPEASPFVTLVSSDGFEFHIRRSAACISGTLKRMLDVQSELSTSLRRGHTDSGWR